MTQRADNIILAEFSPARVCLLLLGVIMMFRETLASPVPELAGSALQLHHRYPIFRWVLASIAGGSVFVVVATLVRMAFFSRTAVSLRNGQLCWAWAFGTISADFRQIAPFSLWRFPGMVLINKLDGKRAYIPSGITKTSSAVLFERLQSELAARMTNDDIP